MIHCAQKISGDGRGKTIGFATINCTKISDENFLEEGVFCVEATIDTKIYIGLVHIGPRPTFDADEKRVEIHLFDFDTQIENGAKIFFTVGKKIRGVQKFADTDALVQQIKKDMKAAKKIFNF